MSDRPNEISYSPHSNAALKSEVERLRAERSDLYQWFEHHHVTGDLSREQLDAMSPKQMADHAYELMADKFHHAEERIALKDKAVATLHERIRELEHETQMWDEHMSQFTDYEGDEAPWQTIEREIKNREAERDQALVSCAVIRLVLEDIVTDDLDRVSGGVKQSAQAALATDAGKAFLERLKEAERLLKLSPIWAANPSWIRERDAWLKGGAK